MAEAPLPPVTITKSDLGPSWSKTTVGLRDELSLQPVKYEGPEDWRDISWQVKKLGPDPKPLPVIIDNNLTADQLLSHSTLPRRYTTIGPNNKAVLFQDESAADIGWVMLVEHENGKGCGLSYIGVVPALEGLGYGSAILRWLQNHYNSVSLGPTAYDTADRGSDAARDRLLNFYARNGFVMSGAGSFYWTNNMPNMELAAQGSTFQVTDMVANGTLYSSNSFRRAYLRQLDQISQLESLLGPDTARAARAWITVEDQIVATQNQLSNPRISP